ncbi:MAG: hypothetical protein WA630_22180 [Mycobacterium sp.]
MLSMRDHDVQDYTTLLHMDATDVGVLTEDDQDCLEELGHYLVSADGWRRFSIWLLHKHFDPTSGEVFVERSFASPPETHTAPMPRADFAPEALKPVAIRFDTKPGLGVGLVGMEFAPPADLGGVAPINNADETVLAGLAERLHARGKIDRFGVRLTRNQLGLSDGQMLSETCDEARRTLSCDVVDRAARRPRTVETTWQWKPVIKRSGPIPIADCVQSCTYSCDLGPPDGPSHVRGHEYSHRPGPGPYPGDPSSSF